MVISTSTKNISSPNRGGGAKRRRGKLRRVNNGGVNNGEANNGEANIGEANIGEVKTESQTKGQKRIQSNFRNKQHRCLKAWITNLSV